MKTFLSAPSLLANRVFSAPSSSGAGRGNNDLPRFISAKKLKNKYSRFSSGIDFEGVDISAIKRKSDAWLVKLFETCYDDALQHFNMPTDLTAMELPCGNFKNFPSLVQSNINNMYSTMEIRKDTCIELIFSMELIMDKAERYRFSANRQIAHSIQEEEHDSGRVVLFSKFLSEEYDIDVLMMFLHGRNKIEGLLGKSLRYIVPTRLNEMELDKHKIPSKKGPKKVANYVLPTKWQFLQDITIPEVPLVAFDTSLLSHVIYVILDKIGDDVKDYTIKLIYASVQRDILSLPSDQAKTGSLSYIPIYSLLRVFCTEYKKVTADVKAKMNDSYIIIQSLNNLNTLCDNNNAIAKDYEDKILVLQSNLAQTDLKITQLQKQLKRYQKKFDNKLSFVSTNQEDSFIDEISLLKQNLIEETTTKLETEQTLEQTKIAFQKHKRHIDSLWKQIPTTSKSSGKKVPKIGKRKGSTGSSDGAGESVTVTSQQQSMLWRKKILHIMQKILVYNYEQYLQNLENEKMKKQRPLTAVSLLSSILPGTTNLSPTSPSFETMKKGDQDNELIVSPANRLLIIETLSRLFTHNTMKQCMYKHLVQRRLEIQQHALLLTYNSDYYQKEQARLRQLEIDRKQKLFMQARKAMVNIITGDLVQQTIVPNATQLAFRALYDTFYYLNLPDKEYIPIYQLFRVDKKYSAYWQNLLKNKFNRLNLPYRMKKLQTSHNYRIKRRIFDSIHSLYLSYHYKTQQVLCLQRNARKFLWSLRFHMYVQHQNQRIAIAQDSYRSKMMKKAHDYLLYWKQYKQDILLTRQLQDIVLDRTYLKCFYTWIYLYKQITLKRFLEGKDKLMKCITVQRYMRGFLVRSRNQKARLRRRIYDAIINYNARKIRYNLLQRRRHFKEYAANLTYRSHIFMFQKCLKVWKRKYNISSGSNQLLHCLHRHKKVCGFQLWLLFYHNMTRFRLRHLILVQATVRMFLIHRRLCYFPSWRPKLVRLQAVLRGYLSWKRYQVRIFYHRKAIIVQRNVRKFLVIKMLKDRRIAQIHKDAGENNYNKILFYLNYYRDLLYEVDQDGNSILHTAAKFACKRVMKLIIKANLYDEVNFYNTQGYTPLHMLLMSPNLGYREEVCKYFLERGFDEDVSTQYENRSCLLVAILANNTGMATQLIEDGHDVNYADNLYLTCLQAACYNGNAKLIDLLIKNGAEINVMGYGSRYPIHDAVISGKIDAFYSLLQHPQIDLGIREGENQQTPLMFACIYSQPEYAKNLLLYHTKRNMDSRHQRRLALEKKKSSLSTMSSQTAVLTDGSYDVLPGGVDAYNRTAAHYAAIVPDTSVLDILRAGELDLEAVDYQGNTPLHLATLNKNYQNVKFLLETGIYSSYQNEDGNHAAHIAAMDDECLNILAILCQYDEFIGRLNYAHQSVWAIAQYYQANANLEFLNQNYSRVDKNVAQNPHLSSEVDRHWERPWDAEVTKHTQNIASEILSTGERMFVDTLTGERTNFPPTLSSQAIINRAQSIALPVQKTVRMVTNQDLAAYNNKTSAIDDEDSDGSSVNIYLDNISLEKFNYKDAFQEQQEEIKEIAINFHNATIIVKWARRKLAYMRVNRIKKEKKAKKNMLIFLRNHLPGFMSWKHLVYYKSAQRIQACARRYLTRKFFFNGYYLYYDHYEYYSSYEIDSLLPLDLVKYHQLMGKNYLLRHKYYQRRLYKILSRTYKYSRVRKDYHLFQYLLRHLPTMTIEDWGQIIYKAKWPVRTAGMYEVYLYPESNNLLFYRHIMTGQCSFQKPRKLIYLDEKEEREVREKEKYGATLHQIDLVIKLQAMWRGYSIRNYFKKVEKALEISRYAEEKYLNMPEKDIHVYNYALFLLAFDQDIDHSRSVFVEALRRMQYRGPDIAFVLYSYAVYAMMSGDENWEDILVIRVRARKAERMHFCEQREKFHRQAKQQGQLSEGDALKLQKLTQLSKGLPNLSAKLRAEVKQARLENGEDDDLSVQTATDDASLFSQMQEGSVTEEKLELRVGRYGKVYDLAHVGFFRYCSLMHNNAFGYELLALCRFLVYDDFSGAFRQFMQAFHHAPDNPSLMKNFDLMLTHYFGKSKAKKDMVVRSKMQEQAKIDADMEERRRIVRDHALLRFNSAKRIQKWYKDQRAQRLFTRFMKAANERIQEIRSFNSAESKPLSKQKKRRVNII